MNVEKYFLMLTNQSWDTFTQSKTTVKRNTQVIKKTEYRKAKEEFPLWHKSYLTVEEAATYSGIGKDKLRELTDDENCPFVLWNGTKRLIKRRVLDEYLDKAYSI